MQNCVRQSVIAAVIMFLAAVAPLSGAATVSENFNDFTLDPAFEESSPGSWTYDARVAQEIGPSRSYIRTVDSDYITVDFVFEVTYTVHDDGPGAGSGIAFVGFGSGTPGEFYGEPDQAIYLHQWPGFPNTGELTVVRTSGDEDQFSTPPDEFVLLGYPGDGRYRARVSKVGDLLTLEVDADYYEGPFVADYSVSRNLSVVAPYLDTTNSRLFFGTEAVNATFDDISLVPEPASSALLLASVVGLPAVLRRRR